ncbi:hypothetical protein MMC16_005748 [Acarospora aff. strigata]|nr:hypothetical protein [Acarospora aff. strigata]
MISWTGPTDQGKRRRQTTLSNLTVYFLFLIGTIIVDAYVPPPEDVVRPPQHVISDHQQPAFEDTRPLAYSPVSSLEQQLLLVEAQDDAQASIAEGSPTPYNTLPALLDALEVMQLRFFELWQGTWPRAIDWTAAVMGTQISATLSTFTRSLDYHVLYTTDSGAAAISAEAIAHENLINKYFTQLTSFYFGENAFALRTQAFDDMLWVVLGWLESVKFINLHMDRHYASASSSADHYNSSAWYAAQFMPSFAHRARLFYDLATQGWNTTLCGGGMLWNPYLTPYKNAITNELFITASASMYLYFPGDENSSPFSAPDNGESKQSSSTARPHDSRYLKAAIDGYKWLSGSNMTNSQGLFTDGYHIRGWQRGRTNNTIGSGRCDIRNEMVYTYNQGVLLSGLRGLWESTGARSYLEDAHTLVRNAIAATGWHANPAQRRQTWAGLGRNGILEEACDAWGTCSQNGQTFKGIFFHHLASFCAPLPTEPLTAGVTFAADTEVWKAHETSCKAYVPWLAHNAAAAYATRDEDGVFGMWWGPPYNVSESRDAGLSNHGQTGAVDYRNAGVPQNSIWRVDVNDRRGKTRDSYEDPERREEGHRDWNERGRGRTAETQSGGVAVLQALWELVHR